MMSWYTITLAISGFIIPWVVVWLTSYYCFVLKPELKFDDQVIIIRKGDDKKKSATRFTGRVVKERRRTRRASSRPPMRPGVEEVGRKARKKFTTSGPSLPGKGKVKGVLKK